jgi:hypothetical protein
MNYPNTKPVCAHNTRQTRSVFKSAPVHLCWPCTERYLENLYVLNRADIDSTLAEIQRALAV